MVYGVYQANLTCIVLYTTQKNSTYSMNVKKLVLRFAAVPEQVNIPIQICREKKSFEAYVQLLKSKLLLNNDADVGIEYISVPEGTGRMMELLEKNEIDLALTVTDAFISNKSRGTHNKAILCGTYVNSPLIWALCGRGNDSFIKKQFADKIKLGEVVKYGISRLGSGSHTMAFYYDFLASKTKELKSTEYLPKCEFVIANNFQQLREGVNRNDFDVFLWETFTTKPWFDSGELTKLGEVSAPWPAFSYVTNIYSNSGSEPNIKELLIRDCLYPAVKEAIDEFTRVSNRDVSIRRIVDEFKHTENDAAQWLASCSYAAHNDMRVDRSSLENSLQILKTIGLAPPQYATDSLWSTSTAADVASETTAGRRQSDVTLTHPRKENAIITLA